MPHFEGLHLRHNVRSLKNSTWRKYRAKLILVVQMFEWKLVGRFKYNSTKCSCCVLEQKSCVKNVVSWNSKTDFSCSSRNFTEAWNQKRNNNFPFQKPKLSSKSISLSLSLVCALFWNQILNLKEFSKNFNFQICIARAPWKWNA